MKTAPRNSNWSQISGVFDRKQNPGLIFYDDFSEGTTLPWQASAGTGTLAKTTANLEWSSGGGAMKYTSSTVSAESSELHRYFPKMPGLKRVVFGGVFAIMDENLSNFAFYLGFRDGTNWQRAKLLHNLSANTWQVDLGGISASANLTTILTRDTSESTSVPRWHQFEIAADFDALKIVGVQIDEIDASFTVSGFPLRVAADTAVPNMLDFAVEYTNITGSPVASNMLFDRLWGYVIS